MASGSAIKSRRAAKRAPSASYLDLVQRLPLRPIRSEAELDRAQAVVDELIDRDRLDVGQRDYLDVLSDLVERYEAEAHPIGKVSEAEMLRFLIDQKGVRQVDVARGASIAESTVSEILAGKKALTRRQMERLAAYFGASPAVFFGEEE